MSTYQDQRFPLRQWQRLESPAEVTDFAAFILRGRAGFRCRENPFQGAALRAATAHLFEKHISQDIEQPCPGTGSRCPLRFRSQGAQNGFLNQIVRQRGVPRQEAGKGTQIWQQGGQGSAHGIRRRCHYVSANALAAIVAMLKKITSALPPPVPCGSTETRGSI